MASLMSLADVSPEEILTYFNKFTNGLVKKGSLPKEKMVQIGLILLRALPASKEAVFEYVGSLYRDIFKEYLTKPQRTDKGLEEESDENDSFIQGIDDVLIDLISGGSASYWSTLLSKWSVKILGEMSQDFANNRMPPVMTNLSTLQELIIFWTNCSASKSLIVILATCLSNMNEDEMFQCFDSLLLNSMKLSPHYDWVIAYIGSRFPDAIVTRMLQCGLTDYHQNATNTSLSRLPTQPLPSVRPVHFPSGSSAPPKTGPSSETVESENISRVPSVVGILSYLALDFEEELMRKIFNLFMKSVDRDAADEYCIGPLYIFYLASQSSVLLRIVAKAFLTNVDIKILNQMAEKAVVRNFKIYTDFPSAVNLMSRTLMRLESEALEMFTFFVDNAVHHDRGETKMDHSKTKTPLPVVSQFCFEVLNELCSIMQKLVYSTSKNMSPDVRILMAMRKHARHFCHLVINTKDRRRHWYFKVLACLAVGDMRNVSSGILSHIFFMEPSSNEFSLFVEIQRSAEMKHANIIDQCTEVVITCLEEPKDKSGNEQIMEKLLNLCRLEIDPEMAMKNKELRKCRQPIYLALQERSLRIVKLFHKSSYKMKLNLLKLLNLLGIPTLKDNVTMPMKLGRAVVTVFYSILADHESIEKMALAYECINYIKKVSPNKATQIITIGFILWGSFSPINVNLFGGIYERGEFENNEEWLQPLFGTPNLMEQNRQLSLISASSNQLFHTGEIGLKPKKPEPKEPTPETRLNTRLVLEAVWGCGCQSFVVKNGANKTPEPRKPQPREENQLTSEMSRILGVILVEYVMPDNLLNSFYWPDEEFIKTTSERDLHVKKKFDNHPFLWDLLDMLATFSVGAWTCQCILRSLLGHLIIQWESTREVSTLSLPQLLTPTQRVIEYLRQAQILLEPLSLSMELLPLVSPYEVYLLLLNIWRYIREYSPQTGQKKNFGCPQKILDVVHNIMQNNIEKCGYLFPLFFKA